MHDNDIDIALDQMQRDGVAIHMWGDAPVAKRWAVASRLAGKSFDPAPKAEPCHGLAFEVEEQVIGLDRGLLAAVEVMDDRFEGIFPQWDDAGLAAFAG